MIPRRSAIRARAIVADAADTRSNVLFFLGMTILSLLLIAGLSNIAFAADSDSDLGDGGKYGGYGVSFEMRQAMVLVENETLANALPFLQREVTNNPSNANAWNLIGFSSRKLGDYPGSEAAYDKALAINPEHKGALQYKGELYLTLGNLAGAEMLLARLNKICSSRCSEARELNDDIAAYKKAQ